MVVEDGQTPLAHQVEVEVILGVEVASGKTKPEGEGARTAAVTVVLV